MPRLARVIAVGMPHHITQRGIGRQAIFTSDKSRHIYLALLHEHATRHQVRLLGYCLMTNHVHVLAIPEHADSLALMFRYAHGRFAQYANAEVCRSGHFWQNRFYSCPMEESAASRALAYIELNPVRAGIAETAAQWKWSSAPSHLGINRDIDGLLDIQWWRDRWTEVDWAMMLASDQSGVEELRRATHTGRPLGSAAFVADLERRLGRKLEKQKGGRPKRNSARAAISGALDADLFRIIPEDLENRPSSFRNFLSSTSR